MYVTDTYSCLFEDIFVHSLLLPLGNKSFVTSRLWVLLCSKFFLFHYHVNFSAMRLHSWVMFFGSIRLEDLCNQELVTFDRHSRAFVSLCSYYHKYIWRFAEISDPLTDLFKDGQWCSPSAPDVLVDVENLKVALISSPVLTYFDVHAAATDLYCDASGGRIGAVLQQTDRDGNVRPVGFYSRKPTPAERRYGTYDRELVGLRDGCLYFRYQLLSVPFTVRTDHNSLRWFLSQPELTDIRQ